MCVCVGGGQSCYGSFNANSISFQLGPNVAQRQCSSDTMKCGYLACRVKEGERRGAGDCIREDLQGIREGKKRKG